MQHTHTPPLTTYRANTEKATARFAKQLASVLLEPASGLFHHGFVMHLHGNLGSGKTTLARALLRALGVQGAVKSPTYGLIEPYELAIPQTTAHEQKNAQKNQALQIYHCDLYRLAAPEEWDAVGGRELAGPGVLLLIEWAEKGVPCVPTADLTIDMECTEDSSQRRIHCTANTERGATACIKR